MEEQRRKKVRNITADILEGLYYAIDDLGTICISKKEAYKYLYGYSESLSDLSRTKIGRWIESLRQNKYVQITGGRGNKSIEFTNKGKLKILESICSGIGSDGKYRFISFDIPENLRLARNQFRRAIKKLGFVQIQKSLWVINKDVSEFVEMASYEFGVERYVIYIVADKTDIDGVIEKKFPK